MENELQHWGIKGMKWGRRRFQNKDGSLTPAGKKRYGDDDDVDETPSPYKSARKSVKDMSDADLDSAIERLRKEQAYGRLYDELNPKTVSKGKQYVTDIFEKGVLPGLTNAGKKLIEESLVKAGGKALGLSKDQTKDTLEVLRKEAETVKLTREKMQNQDWINKNLKEKADNKASEAARESAEKAAKKAADQSAKKAAGKNDDPSQNASQGKGTKDAKRDKRANEPETVTGEVEGDGTSKFTGWGSDKFSKQYDVDVDFSNSTVSKVKNSSTTAIGKSVVTGLLNSRTLQLPGPTYTSEDD